MNSEFRKLDIAFKRFFYEVAKSIGLIYLVKNIKFLELKSWVKDLETEDYLIAYYSGK